MKLLKYILAVALLLAPLSAFAVNITVPSAPSNGYTLVSLPAGNYQATSSLFVTQTGNIGVGTVAPTAVNANARLTVAGISSQDVIASTTDNTTLSDAIMRVYAPGSSLFMGSHGTNQITTQYGITVGGWGEIGAVNSSFGTSNGLLIGTRTTATPIVFGTNSLERMRILSTGAVGIGTSNPGSILEIQGTTTTATGQAFIARDSNALKIFQISDNGSTTIGNFGTCSGTNALTTNSSGTIVCGAITAGSGSVTTALQGQNAFYNANGTTVIGTSTIFEAQNTYVGIGTTTPFAKLSIQANSNDNSPPVLFAIGSSTASATTTLLSVSNTGSFSFGTTSLSAGFQIINKDATAGNGLTLTTTAQGNGVTLQEVSIAGGEALNIYGKSSFTIGFGGAESILSNSALMRFGTDINRNTASNAAYLWDEPGTIGNLTASTENTIFYFGAPGIVGGQTHANGALLTDRNTIWTPTLDQFASFSAGNVITNAATFAILNGPVVPVTGNGKITNSFALLLGSTTPFTASSVGFNANASTTNSYGLGVYAAAGPTNNYAATFMFGNVGIGTTSPFANLSIHANNGDTNTNLFAIGSSTQSATTSLYVIDNVGHNNFGGTAPSCGTGCASLIGDDNGGAITTSAAATSVTVNFANSWRATPVCTVSDNSTAVTGDISSISATSFTTSFSIGLTGVVYYQCAVYQ